MRGILTLFAAVFLAASSATAQMDDGTLSGPMDGSATDITIEAAVGDQVCWSITGSGHVGHVAIHWDDVSHQAATVNATTGAGANGTATDGDAGNATSDNATFADYDLGFAYPDNAVELDAEGYALPGRFCANVTATAGSTIYVVAHVMDVSGAPGLLSRELTLTTRALDDGVPDDPTPDTDDNDTGNDSDPTPEEPGGPQEANPPSRTPSVGLLAAVSVAGLAALALRRRG